MMLRRQLLWLSKARPQAATPNFSENLETIWKFVLAGPIDGQFSGSLDVAKLSPLLTLQLPPPCRSSALFQRLPHSLNSTQF